MMMSKKRHPSICLFFITGNVFIKLFVYIFAKVNKLFYIRCYNKGKYMERSDFKLSLNAIRKANERLVSHGSLVAYSAKGSGIAVRTRVDGVEKVREISKSEINKSYSKALKSYATKI